ncbi:MAG: DJ-1/PfpI family protein [Proteobacteria bacterium]|nr:DJ-1/PfpI family protein [Pseudomonadota bacterium]
MPTHRITILAFDGMEVLDFAGPFEVFTTASRVHARRLPDAPPLFTVASVAPRPGPVRARAGLAMLPDHALDGAPAADLLLVPGGVVDACVRDASLLGWIARAHADTRITASVCTGAFVLAAAGVLVDGPVTTHWEDADALQAAYPALQVDASQRWVDQGRLVTSAGISAGIDMSLHLVARLADAALAAATARQMDYPWAQP